MKGKPWTDLDEPFSLDFTPDPASTRFVCEGRGTGELVRSEDSLAITIYDQQSSAAHYKITLFQPSGDKKTDGN